MSSDNATAYELANWQGNHYLNDILRPPSRHDVPYKAVLRTLQQKFHALIRHDLGNEVDRECLMLPDLAVLTELEKPEMWFPLKDNRVDRPRVRYSGCRTIIFEANLVRAISIVLKSCPYGL